MIGNVRESSDYSGLVSFDSVELGCLRQIIQDPGIDKANDHGTGCMDRTGGHPSIIAPTEAQ